MSVVFRIGSKSISEVILSTVLPRALARGSAFTMPIGMQSRYPEVWYENPFVSSNFGFEDSVPSRYQVVPIESVSIDSMAEALLELNVSTSILHKDLEFEPWPSLYLTKEEYEERPSTSGSLEGKPYWLLCCGVYPEWQEWNWDDSRWQYLADILTHDQSFPLVAQVGDSNAGRHVVLKRCVSLLGRTNLRDLMWLCRHAKGVICNGGCLAWMALAVGTPYISIGPACRSDVFSNSAGFGTLCSSSMNSTCGFIRKPEVIYCVEPNRPTTPVAACLNELTPRMLADFVIDFDSKLPK